MKETAADEVTPDGEEATTISPGPSVEHNKRKKVEKVSPSVEQLVNVLQAGIQSQEEREKSKEDDGDQLFLLSLLSAMKQIPEHLRLSVRMQMMQVIGNAYTRTMSSNLITNHPQEPNLQYQFSQQPQHQYLQQLHPSNHSLNNTLIPLQPTMHQTFTTVHSPESVTSPGTQYSCDSEIDNLFQD
ncbi:hypothetical protein B7P43_G02559 [Cryptotermes secundus]|uniref:BESS domain-containing protein n=1 Tax=Cryptotermes secundus TaxID=105785 RepID=A0A2J7R3E7_9NEOP|nr:hypothetical protein B7P43_G02559 [Cryptotermes secundus]PNF35355.1 hypothetical protein B7P43_G02559 [Cryptotermes secundus]